MNVFNDKLNIIRKKERKISFTSSSIIEESYQMILLLKDLLLELKTIVLTKGFKTEMEEIYFFKIVKPEVLGKLIYYNKVYRIETGCPVNNGKLFIKYFTKHLEQLKTSYKEYVCNSDFYKYYKSKRTDLDSKFFRLNQIDLHGGLNSIVFEIDEKFSTYYDYKVSRIISNDLLYEYLIQRMDSEEKPSIFQNQPVDSYNKDVFWTDSKNALVELIYALHASGAVSNGRIGISKMSMVFEIIFRVKLGDLHHSFHRMKDRSGSKTAFLDHLKANLEKYMDKDL